jgi:hypothetical protein
MQRVELLRHRAAGGPENRFEKEVMTGKNLLQFAAFGLVEKDGFDAVVPGCLDFGDSLIAWAADAPEITIKFQLQKRPD